MQKTEKLIETARIYAETYRKNPIGREVEGTPKLLDTLADTLEQQSQKDEPSHFILSFGHDVNDLIEVKNYTAEFDKILADTIAAWRESSENFNDFVYEKLEQAGFEVRRMDYTQITI